MEPAISQQFSSSTLIEGLGLVADSVPMVPSEPSDADLVNELAKLEAGHVFPCRGGLINFELNSNLGGRPLEWPMLALDIGQAMKNAMVAAKASDAGGNALARALATPQQKSFVSTVAWKQTES